jgi:hypothetical protein
LVCLLRQGSIAVKADRRAPLPFRKPEQKKVVNRELERTNLTDQMNKRLRLI